MDGSIDSKPLSLDNSCFEFRQRLKPFKSRPGKKSDSFHFWTRLEGIDFSNLACNLLCFDVSCRSGMHMLHPFRIKAQQESNHSEILYRMGCLYRMLRGNRRTTGLYETSYYMTTCLLFYAGLWGWHFLHRTDCKVAILQTTEETWVCFEKACTKGWSEDRPGTSKGNYTCHYTIAQWMYRTHTSVGIRICIYMQV